MTFRLFVNSLNGVDVEPEYNYKESGVKFETRQRGKTGREYFYKWGEWEEIKMSVTYVNSKFKSIVNSYWLSNADLLWKEVGVSGITSVHIINKESPISGLSEPYTDLYKGVIELGTY